MISLMTNFAIAILGLAILIFLIHLISWWKEKKFKRNPYSEYCRYCFSEQSAFMVDGIWCCFDCSKKCYCGNIKLPHHISCQECYLRCRQ